MKTFTNPPRDPAFFSNNALTWKVAKSLIVTGTIFGVLTEFAVVFGLFDKHLTENLPETWVWLRYLNIAASAFLVFTLARERIRIGRQASRIIVAKDFRQLGFAANSVIIIAAVLVFGASVTLSVIGTVNGVTVAMPTPTLTGTDHVGQFTVKETEAQQQQYATAKADIEKQYDARISAIKKMHNAKIAPLEARKKGASAADKRWLQTKIDPLIAAREEAISVLRAEKSEKLLALTDQHNALVATTTAQAQAERQTILEANQRTANRHAWLMEKSKTWLPAVIIICLLLMLVGLYLEELFKHKAGMQEIEEPDEHDFLPPVHVELATAFKRRWLGLLRNRIARFNGKTQELEVEANMPALIRKQYNAYKERLITIGQDAATETTTPPLATAQTEEPTTDAKPGKHLHKLAGFKRYPDGTDTENTGILHTVGNVENPVYTQNTHVYTPEVDALLAQYKRARRDYFAYLNKQRNNDGRPETVQAGIEKAQAVMAIYKDKIAENGYALIETRLKIYLEKK